MKKDHDAIRTMIPQKIISDNIVKLYGNITVIPYAKANLKTENLFF